MSLNDFYYSISLAHLRKAGHSYGRSSGWKWRQQWEQERNNIVLYGAALCRSDVLKSPCVCLPICVHASAIEKEKKKRNSLWEEKKAWFLIMGLLACPIYGNQHSPRGWKTRNPGEREAKAEEKINTALWNKKCGLFTLHWSDDAGETPHSAIKLRL